MHKQDEEERQTGKTDIISEQIAIEEMAGTLNNIANMKLREGTLPRMLQGQESEIRQDAVLKALGWYKKYVLWSNQTEHENWCPERSLNYALKWTILDHLKVISKHMPSVDDPKFMGLVCAYGSKKDKIDYNIAQIAEILRIAVRKALESGEITSSNAMIAMMVIDEEKPVQAIARQLGVDRSGIYQQLRKLKHVLKPILEQMDYPVIPE
jgi:hypothetical protein